MKQILTSPKSRSHRRVIVGPRCPTELTVLNVEREVLDRDITGRAEHSMGEPNNITGVAHDDVGVDDGLVVVEMGAAVLKKMHTCVRARLTGPADSYVHWGLHEITFEGTHPAVSEY